MAGKDVAEKRYLALNDVFADIVNAVLFDGMRVIEEDELEAESEQSAYKFESGLHGQERDVAKYWRKNEVRIALFGLENQTAEDPAMPLRVIGYDGASYRGQLLGSGRSGPWHPVVTLVLYFGRKPWAGPHSLADCLEIDERLRPFVSDYKIHVFDIPRLAAETVARFTTDFRLVAEYFKAAADGTDFKPEHDLITHVDAFFDLMKELTGDKRFEESAECIEHFKKDGGVHMCEVLDRIERRGIAIGEARGEARGEAIGEARGQAIGEAAMLRRLMESTGWTLGQALDTLKAGPEERARFEMMFRGMQQ